MLRSPGLKNETVDAGQAESPDQAEGAAVLPIARVTTFRIDQLPGPATKITNLGALKIVLGLRHFLLYWVFVIVFALMTGLTVNLIL